MAAKETVLIVDLDSALASILGAYLTAQGYRVQFTTRVRECLRKIENQKFSHIFLDPDLGPDSAAQVLTELMAKSGFNALTPLTLMTAKTEMSIPAASTKRLHSILPKPFSLQEFAYQLGAKKK